MGKKTAAMAQAGALDTGSGAGLLDQNRLDAEMEALNARFQGLSRSDAVMADARNASIQGQNAAAAARAGGLAGAAGILGDSLAAAAAYGLAGRGPGGARGPGYDIAAWKYRPLALDARKLTAGQHWSR